MPLVPHVAAGQIVASTWGNLVADHTVMRFTTAAQRTAQLPAPLTGQLTSRDDAPGVVEYWTGTAWVALGLTYERVILTNFGGGVYQGTPQEISITTFTMPFLGVIILNAIAQFAPVGGQPATPMNVLIDAGPTSTPVATVAPTYVGPAAAASAYYGSLPYTYAWRNVAKGTAVNLKVRYSVNAAAAQLSHHVATIRVIPAEL